MKIKRLIVTAVLVGGMLASGIAYAATPVLSVSGSSASAVQITVSGADPNANVTFYYNGGAASKVLGVTDGSGSFSAQLNTSGYDPAIISGNTVYVAVNGQQSAAQNWSLSGTTSSGGLTPVLSQTNVTVGLSQSVTVTSTGGTTGVYMLSNSNSAAANVQANGTQITVTGSQLGTATVAICYVGTSSNCTNLNVTVQSGSVVAFNPASVSIAAGQNSTVTISGGNGAYALSTNSNSAVASGAISGSTLTVSGITAGTATFTICDTAQNCGSLPVTVTSSVSAGGGVVFGSSNPSLGVGGSVNIALSGGSGYYIASNSNSAAVAASVNGNALILTGLANGSAVLSVCGSGLTCNNLTVTVGTGTAAATTTQTPAQSQSLLASIQAMQTQLAQILAQIQTMTSTLSQLAASAAAGSSSGGGSAASSGSFTLFLSLGSQNAEVTLLQQRLTALGFYTGPITGYFGPATEAAVAKYQTAHNIPAKGYVGPDTRSVLNSGK